VWIIAFIYVGGGDVVEREGERFNGTRLREELFGVDEL
jgi:hypothetical protein